MFGPISSFSAVTIVPAVPDPLEGDQVRSLTSPRSRPPAVEPKKTVFPLTGAPLVPIDDVLPVAPPSQLIELKGSEGVPLTRPVKQVTCFMVTK
jgi:hypothetical protein